MTLFLLGNKPIANGQKPKNDMVMMADSFGGSWTANAARKTRFFKMMRIQFLRHLDAKYI